MAIYINADTGEYPLNEDNVRRHFPLTSFAQFNPEFPPPYMVVSNTPIPPYDSNVDTVAETPPALVNGSWVRVWAITPLTPAELQTRQEMLRAQIVNNTQARLDNFAKTKGYDNIVSACSYATSAHPKYGVEGRYCVEAREQTWDAMFAIDTEILNGARPVPTGFADIEPLLPVLVWP